MATPEKKMSPKIDDLLKRQPQYLLNRIRESVRANTRGCWEMAELLFLTYYETYEDKPIWAHFKYKSWNDFVEKEAGLHYSTAANWRRAYHAALHRWGVRTTAEMAELTEGVSWTNVLTLSKASDVGKNNIRMWVRRARNMTCCGLRREVLGEETTITVALHLPTKAGEQLRELLSATKDERGLSTQGEALLFLLNKRKLLQDV